MDVQSGNQSVDASGVVIMSTTEGIDLERVRLGFAEIVRREFAFLADFGFAEVESSPTIVRYQKGDLDLNVYHGRQSYEIGMQLGHGDEQVSMEQLIRVTDPAGWQKYRVYVATNPAGVVSGVTRLAELARRYGDRALRDAPEFFADLRRQRESWKDAFALDVLERQTRPKAEAAFREGRYREAAELYERITARLSPAEKAKLAAARKRS